METGTGESLAVRKVECTFIQSFEVYGVCAVVVPVHHPTGPLPGKWYKPLRPYGV
jgi:hypothetical protein